MVDSTDPNSGDGVKIGDENKVKFDLIPPQALWALARVYTYGATKVAPRNWEKGMRWGRAYAALQRHLNAFWSGESFDRESSCHHLMCVVFWAFTLYMYEIFQRGEDDRSLYMTWGSQLPDNNTGQSNYMIPRGTEVCDEGHQDDNTRSKVSIHPPGHIVWDDQNKK